MTSPLYENEIIIDDDTHERIWSPDANGFGTGWEKEDELEGYGAVAMPFPESLMINPSEFQARIEEREAQKRQLSHLMLKAGLPCKHQSDTNFCWINAPAHSMEVLGILANQPYVELSPASGACVIKGFRNQGGWAKDALMFIQERGLVPASLWPANAINRKYDTQDNWKQALPFRVAKWITGTPRNINQVASLCLQDIPVPVAFNWWRHEVTAYDVIWLNGRIALRCRNSWGMGYGSSGFFILQGSKMYPDDIVAPLSVRVGKTVDFTRNLAV